MSTGHRLFQAAKELLRADGPDAIARLVLEEMLRETGAGRGFVVVKTGDDYDERFDVCFDEGRRSSEERRFSRTLVRESIRTKAVVYTADPGGDPRFRHGESVAALRGAPALVVPLVYLDEVFAAVYLDSPEGRLNHSEDVREFLSELAGAAATSMFRAIELERWRKRSRELERDLFLRYDFTGIVTRDPSMISLLETVGQVAPSDATVLIRGDTGTGKELIARALHVNSGRREHPFVVVHCAALPQSLLESELFGHVEGAFSGAQRDRAGRIAAAHRGTLFLDEVAEIPPDVQAKLLRALQFGEVQRLGADLPIKVDIRVVAATHCDLAANVEEGLFRRDLFYRLKVIELEIPPLRSRKGDIWPLVEYFTQKYRPEVSWSNEARHLLSEHDFPGNVRELDNLVQRCCALARGPEIGAEHLPRDLVSLGAGVSSFSLFTNDELKRAREQALGRVELEFLTGLMAKHDGNLSKASREAQLTRSYLQKLMARYKLRARGPE